MSVRLGPGLFHGRTIRKAANADLILTDVRYTDGARRHHHERAYFCLIRDGVYDETYARRARSCRSGMLVYHPPGESHAQTVRTPTVADQSHFTRTFKRFTGLTPRQYRTFLAFKIR